MSFGKYVPLASTVSEFTFRMALVLDLSAEASVKIYPLYEQASRALSRLADLLCLASIGPSLGFDNRAEIRCSSGEHL